MIEAIAVLTGFVLALAASHRIGRLAGRADARRSVHAAIVTHRAMRLRAELEDGSASDQGAATSIGYMLKSVDVAGLEAVLLEERFRLTTSGTLLPNR